MKRKKTNGPSSKISLQKVSGQLVFALVGGWGGKRRGSGRKNRSGQQNHMARPQIEAKWPLHITLRLNPGVLSLRRKFVLKVFIEGVQRARKFGLKINEFSILANHFHLIAETDNNENLSRGMQSLLIRLAKQVKKLAKELNRPISGAVFVERYHLNVLKTPTEMKNALIYVLTNEDKHAGQKPEPSIFSSSFCFQERDRLKIKYSPKKLNDVKRFWRSFVQVKQVSSRKRPQSLPLPLSQAQSWLGSVGWQKALI